MKRLLMLSPYKIGDVTTGQALIATQTFNYFSQYFRAAPKVLNFRLPQQNPPAIDADEAISGTPLDKISILRAFFGRTDEDSRRFLARVAEISGDYDQAIWFGSAYDSATVQLPDFCRCPIAFHITDSITLFQERRIDRKSNLLHSAIARRVERRVLSSPYSHFIYCSQEDYERARSLAPKSQSDRIYLNPIGVDTDLFFPRPSERSEGGPLRLLFSGVMEYQPNIEAALYLITKIAPLIQTNVSIRIVGRNPHPSIISAAANSPNIQVVGFVESMPQECANSDILIAPMISAAGVKIKILEALASGLPVLASPLCIAAFPTPPQGILTANSAPEYARIIGTTLSNPSTRKALGLAGREFIKNGWTWDARSSRLLALFQPERQAHNGRPVGS